MIDDSNYPHPPPAPWPPPPPERRRDRIVRAVFKWTVVTVLVAGVLFGGVRKPVQRD